MVSATSSGSPPCISEGITMRATVRVPSGILAVMSVSMNPGATALMVPPWAAKSAALARTMPITPPLEAA